MAYPEHRNDEHLRAVNSDESGQELSSELADEDHAGEEGTLDDNEYYAEEYPVAKSDLFTQITAIFCLLLIAAWTGFYIWSQLDTIAQPTDLAVIPALISAWAMPVILIIAVYWLVSRRRSAQAAYFHDQAILVDDAGRELEARLQRMNGELAIAREFIANQSTQLESLGRVAVSDLTQHAERISALVGDSKNNMETVAKVSGIAEKNMSKLREQMPVVIGTSKNMVNQIGSAELAAQRQIQGMLTGFKKINEFGKASDQQIIDLENRVETAVGSLQTKLNEIESTGQKTSDMLIENSQKTADLLGSNQNSAEESFRNFASELEKNLLATGQQLATQIEQFRGLTAEIDEGQNGQIARMNQSIEDLEARITQIHANLENGEQTASDKTAQMSFALSALRSELDHISGSLSASDAMAEQLQLKSSEMRSDFTDLAKNIEEVIADKFESIVSMLDKNVQQTGSAAENIQNMQEAMENLDKLTNENILILCEQEQHINRYSTAFSDFSDRNAEQCKEAEQALAILAQSIEEIEKAGDTKILSKLREIGNSSDNLLAKVQTDIDNIVHKLTTEMGERSSEALESSIREKSDEVIGKLQMAVNNALGATHQASASLTSQLDKVDQLAANLEERIAHMRDSAQQPNDQELSRNLALLTESLNSTSIDVAKVLSNDVTDTAWAAYLKGDRGVFTRRAVRLLNNSETREIAEHYENEPEFHDTVNRYIHDFEAILRDLLSTRNGEAISVTLLSSDMGKLYVALAQAIERFR
ncbi:hypothetical protein ACR9YC_06605 [Parasphingorhabdus sp. DH2-15]|uniref:hypothetical protein n=1 Tax=Parasphingorhabdus sp. DH2-15 TaxID=3444112 RepID=UPI003F686309